MFETCDESQDQRYRHLYDALRCVVAGGASVWFSLLFWVRAQKWQDGLPTDLSYFVLYFQLPLALALALGWHLVARSRGFSAVVGWFCLVISVPVFLLIIVKYLTGQGVLAYCRGSANQDL